MEKDEKLSNIQIVLLLLYGSRMVKKTLKEYKQMTNKKREYSPLSKM